MTIQCPHCQTKYRLEENLIGDRPNLQFRCNKCGENFSIVLPPLAGPTCLHGLFLFSIKMNSTADSGPFRHLNRQPIL